MKRRWLFWVLVIVFVWVMISRLTEIEKLAETLRRAQWQWVAVAALLQIAYYIVYTALYWSAFDIVGVRSRVRELLPVTFASIFVNVAAPAGGTSGMALFVDDASHRGESAPRAAVGALLALVADFGGFLVVLTLGLVYLFVHHDLKAYEVIGALLLLAVIGGLTALLLIGLWRPGWLHRLMGWTQRLVNGAAAAIRRAGFLPEGWAEKNAAEFVEASLAVSARPEALLRTLAISLTACLVDLTSLYCLFLAFHQAVSAGILVAGFAMGILFWIVSITPQGIGVVEGMMTLVFTSLGVPAERAAVIAIAFRGLTFWVPLLIGFLLLRRIKAFGAEETTRSEVWEIRLAALLTAAMGVINVLSAVTPSLHDRLRLLEKYSPFGVNSGGHLTAALAGFALLLLAASLWRRKRVAWLLSVAILLLSILAHLIKGLDYEEAALAGGLALWLISLRDHFHARSDRPSIRQGAQTALAALLFTLAYGVAGFYLLDRHFQANFGLWAALRQTVVMFTAFYDPGLQPITGFGRYFADSIYVVGAGTFGYALLMLVRPVLARQRASPDERARAWEIVRAYGRTSLARLALLDDKLYFFSPGGSLIAYIAEGRVALTLGDPIGPRRDAAGAVAAFRAFCAPNDWEPVFYQVLPTQLKVYKEAGFNALCVGHEAIVDLSAFTLAGGENKNVRNSVNKMIRLGYTAGVVEPPHPPALLRELNAISDEWLTLMRGTEKRFSLGWFDDDYLDTCPIILVRDAQGTIQAFANILSEFQASEVSIDLMRHRRQAEKGQMDFLFASLFEWAKARGCAAFDLGLSALSGIGQQPEDPLIERALHYIYEHVDQFYNFKGLHAFKEKFHPKWSPRYLVYPSLASLPTLTVALLRADSGDDLLGGYLRHNK